MKLVFVYITGYKNFDNIQLNLGASCIFEVATQNMDIVIDFSCNNRYIEDLYSPLEGISVIVGENGCGKTNIFRFIHDVLNNQLNIIGLKYLFVFENNGTFRIKKGDGFRNVYVRSTLINNRCDIEGVFFEQADSVPLSIYYNPILDFANLSTYTNHEIDRLDISSNYLYYNDSNVEARRHSDPIRAYLSRETERQLVFIFWCKKNWKEVNSIIPIPDKVFIEMKDIYDYKDDVIKKYHNVPWDFRRYLEELLNKSYTVKVEDVQTLKREWFHVFLKNMIAAMETTNLYLSEGVVNLDYEKWKIEDWEEAFYHFVHNQNILDSDGVLNMWKELSYVIDTGKLQIDGHQGHGVICQVEKIEKLKKSYDTYVEMLARVYADRLYIPLIEFGWRQLSSGEKAFLNLFARFLYIKSWIEQRTKDISMPWSYPEELIILLDEGEMGFHLQWQKEYVFNLYMFLPIILQFTSEGIGIKPKLHLILATHSPISLSDIPNYNVAYLKRDLTGDGSRIFTADTNLKKTFGANIHSLMIDSFFLQNGLMGRFAKNKIKQMIADIECITGINEFERCRKKIDLINEPILRERLLMELNSKYPVAQKKDFLEKQIEKLVKELDNLQKA